MTTTTNTRKESRAPRYHAFHVVSGSGKDKPNRWTRIGVVFDHDDGEGGTLILDTLPIAFDGRIVLRAPKAE